MVVRVENSAPQGSDDCAPFSGLACSWEPTDQGYRIRRGACARTIREAFASRKMRDGVALWPILADHKAELPFGWVASAEEREDGLYITGYLDATVPEARKAFSAARSGRSNGLSLGFKVIAEHREAGIRVIDELEIFEISVGSNPIDRNARLAVKSFSDTEHAIIRALAQEQESEKTMGNYGYVDDDDEYGERPLLGATGGESDFERAWRAQVGEPQPYHVEWGHPDESRVEFERAWRAELREEDDLWLLTDKNRIKELQRRQKEKQEKRQKQHEALLAERRETADRQKAWNRETFTAEDFSRLTGIDVNWCRSLFQQYVTSGLVAPVVEAPLTLTRSAVQLIGRRSAQDIEFQTLKAARKLAERTA